MKHFLTIHLSISTDEPLTLAVSEDLRYAIQTSEVFPTGAVEISSITPDSDSQAAYTRGLSTPITLLNPSPITFTKDVSTLLERHSITVKQSKRGEPEWRVINDCWGEPLGLPGLRGKLVLTNGIHAIVLVGYAGEEKPRWAQIMFGNFIPDKPETLPVELRRVVVEEDTVGNLFDGLFADL